jgi:predicted amidohydrolase YtcJ
MIKKFDIVGKLGGVALFACTALLGCSSPEQPPQTNATTEPQAAPQAEPQAVAQAAPDFVFLNGVVLTVDEDFSTAEAVAVTGNVISAVGTTEDISELAGANTEVIDLGGKTMTPGLIDNHNHLIYNAAIWPNNTRLSDARTRKQALEILAAKAEEIGPGDGSEHIIFGFGGWKPLQFSDDTSNFTRAELDAAMPNNPAVVGGWGGATLNSKAMEFAGITTDMPDPEPNIGKIWRDENGEPTGYFSGSIFIKWELRPLFPEVTAETVVTGLKAEIDDYLALGVTTSMTYNGPEFPEPLLYHVRDHFADTPDQKMRIYYPPHFNNNVTAWTPDEVAYVIEGLNTQKPFTGSDMFQLTHFGEHVYLPIPGNGDVPEEDWAIYKEIATAAAANGWQLSEHAHRHSIMEREIEIYEEINEEYPITDLRWRVEHSTTISRDLIERMKALGMLVSIQSHIAISDPESRAASRFRAEAFAQRDIPPLGDIRDSGITYGFGSDAQIAGQDSPFFSIYWLVTGKDTTGQPYFTRGTLTREEALIGYTRSNAYLIFKEDKLGTIEVGKLADLVVLDRDYLTVPGDDLRDLKSVLTMVDGRIVYESADFEGATASR